MEPVSPLTGAVKLWPHQHDAVEAVCEEFTAQRQGLVVMACGTGKTFVAAQVSARVATCGQVLVVVPTLELLAQTAREYAGYLEGGLGRLVAVCSEETATLEAREVVEQMEQLHAPVTVDPAVLSEVVDGGGRVTVVVTFASVRVVEEAHRDYGLPEWDLVIVDEAHRSAGKAGRAWNGVHELPSRRRLYMTATPRILKSADDGDVSMHDQRIFGREVYRLPFAKAIDAGLLADYRVLVTIVSDAEVAKLTADREVVSVDGHRLPARMLAAQVAVARAIAAYDLRRVITYHRRVLEAKRFAATLEHVLPLLPPAERPTRPVHADYVAGNMPHEVRRARLGRLRRPGDGATLIANARVLAEGIDIPALDAVAFVDPKDSAIEVVQAVGRALRRGEDTAKTATIIIPVILPDGADPETVLENSEFETVWRIVRALRAHDERIADELDRRRAHWNTHDNPGARGPNYMPSWLEVTGAPVEAWFADAIALKVIRETTSQWWEAYGLACQYAETHGSLTITADTDIVLPGTPRNGYVGRITLSEWLAAQRRDHREGDMPSDRIAALERIGIVWDPHEQRWLDNYAETQAYREREGHLEPPRDHPVAKWLTTQRYLKRRSELSDARAALLEELGIVWEPMDDRTTASLRALRAFRTKHGHLRVPFNHPLRRSIDYYRARRQAGLLAEPVRQKLDQLGMIWDARADQWYASYDQVAAFRRQNGHVRIPRDAEHLALARWVVHQRTRWRKGKLTTEEQRLLTELGITSQGRPPND